MNSATWRKVSGAVIDKYLETCLGEAPENYYTNQERMALESFRQVAKDRVSQTQDPDMICILLEDLVDQFFEEFNAEDITAESEASEPSTWGEASSTGPDAQ